MLTNGQNRNMAMGMQGNQNQGGSANFGGLKTFIPGRFVNDANDISNQEIPMDGTLCLFPQSDFGVIYARQWTAQGLAAIKYVPEQIPQNQNSQIAELSWVYQRMDNLERKIDKLISKTNRQYHKNRASEKNGGQ